MALNFSIDPNLNLNLIQSQKLLLTPQLKQALDILGMSSQELLGFIGKQMEENPVLVLYECNNDSDNTCNQECANEGWYDTYPEEDASPEEEKNHEYECKNNLENRITLKEYLSLQLHSLNPSPETVRVGEYLIDNIDENGYLETGLSDAAAYYNAPVADILEVLELLQSFDPPGICSRNLKECLVIQLRQIKCDDSDVFNIVENYLDDVATNKFQKIIRQTGMSKKRLNDIVKIIRSLEPKPGREFYKCSGIRLQAPDIIIKNIDGACIPVVNDDAFPDVNISDYYRRMNGNDLEENTRCFLRKRINNALWLIKCIEQRKYIIIQLTGFIIKENSFFFTKRSQNYKICSFEKAAEELNIHASIIRQATMGKYLQCCWGMFELTEFFNLKVE